jgi:phosphate starvation-inducible protein PhoH and related proteins
LQIKGDEEGVELTERILNQLYQQLQKGHSLLEEDFHKAVLMLSDHHDASLNDLLEEVIYVAGQRKEIKPKTAAQKSYIQAIKSHAITFGIGPAGTGKTYLAMACAVSALLQGSVRRIILTRPAVEAGERLGFLPGDLVDKVDPYLRPLYDALDEMLDFEKTTKLLDRGDIEVAPLAFMRGRTLNDAFVILDEAQNSTMEQMKMFLTRLGRNSVAVVNGDMTQVDLAHDKKSGLIHAVDVLSSIEGIAMKYLTDKDVVRHPLVQEIIVAYEAYENKKSKDRVVAYPRKN